TNRNRRVPETEVQLWCYQQIRRSDVSHSNSWRAPMHSNDHENDPRDITDRVEYEEHARASQAYQDESARHDRPFDESAKRQNGKDGRCIDPLLAQNKKSDVG